MKMAKQEWINLFRNKILLISVIAITFIPILYSSIFDKSVWDPYGRAKDLPVAVVNEDKPTELLGQKMNVGQQVVDNLKKDHQLDWHFVSKEEAEKGMKDLKYYMIVTITEDFSKNAASIINKTPEKMEIVYTTNDSLNYIANEISTVGATALETQVREQVVTAYATAVVEAGEKLVGALGQAADGANQLAGGGSQLQTGLKQYTDGVSQADDGSNQLADGTGQLANSIGPLASGVSQLDSGANQLSSALNQANSALAPVQNNITGIDAGLTQLAAGTQDLANALTTFENNLDPNVKVILDNDLQNIRNEINSIITNKDKLLGISGEATAVADQATVASNSLSGANLEIQKIQTDIDSYVAGLLSDTTIPEDEKANIVSSITNKVDTILNEQIASATAQINTSLVTVESELATLSARAAELSTSANDVSNITNAMAASAQQLSASEASIQAGVNTFDSLLNQVPGSSNAVGLTNGLYAISSDLNLVATKLPTALTGINQLTTGSEQLSSGLDQLQSQIPTLSSGVNQLNTGADQLQAGLAELNENSPELMSGIGQLEGGAKELASALDEGVNESSTLKITKKNIDQFAAPTSLKNDEYSKVANYGEALAPYIMSLALFVGSMLFNFIYPIRKISIAGQSSGAWWLSKVSLGFGVSSMMAVIQASVMLLIGLHVDNVFQFFLTAFVSAWSYMAITMFLAMTFDNPGRFVAMILLVLQLGGAGGTFPIQLQAPFFSMIHPYLPMSYSVYAFREAISGGIGAPLFTKSILILAVLMIVFVALLRYSMHILQKKHLQNVSELNDNQKLQGLEN
ncbi:hypothetical protein IGL98_000056 [Enterococcus sp. DIV0840]|uniref:YhgE/Pip domain-containing protein n=1 Tax=Enterococcus TaxID=1350 RepID=UPI001A8DBD59|nr:MULTISPECIES: YhgE/Pip domain-containing protein [Enterococcus]MBO0434783.1 YhgE/Pip domain-containing protein [Enterococcus sp. DIV0849a]MBO0474139.1 YhgE/Pip domain-containing protein [Enterococcus ureasiticus]